MMNATAKTKLNKILPPDMPENEDNRLDEQWLDSVHQEWLNQPKPTIKELFTIFPEAEAVLQTKTKEEYEVIETELRLIQQGIEEDRTYDGNTRWFLSEFRRYFIWPNIEKAAKRILSYRRQLFLANRQEEEDSAISRSKIESAKAVPIESMIETKRSAGKRAYANCPFHEDRTPSFVIYRDQNTFHCFGCSAHGDVISFVMQKEQIGFKDAIRLLTRI